MGIASREDKQRVLTALKDTNSKYAKPFEKGKMARVSFLGGNWEEYAQIVMSMVIADTLLDIHEQLEILNDRVEALRGSNAPTGSGQRVPPPPPPVEFR